MESRPGPGPTNLILAKHCQPQSGSHSRVLSAARLQVPLAVHVPPQLLAPATASLSLGDHRHSDC
eukprot:3052302-Rhodomonas_salina.1